MTGDALCSVDLSALELSAKDLDIVKAVQLYRDYGCFVVRGLMTPYVDAVRRDIMASVDKALSLIDKATKVPEGWTTLDGTLWLPAPKNFNRDKQVMVTSCTYTTSAAFFQSGLDSRMLDLAEAALGPNVEMFLNGQCLVKEPVGGHPKLLHQDAAYFEHRYDGPFSALCYAVDTDVKKGALYVVPGSHNLGMLKHIDTETHLGLDAKEWPWERAIPIEGKAGDAIFFHTKTVHGSKPNYTDSARPVFIHRYRAANDFVAISGTTTANRSEAEKRTLEEARKENLPGLMVRGFRPWIEQREEPQP